MNEEKRNTQENESNWFTKAIQNVKKAKKEEVTGDLDARYIGSKILSSVESINNLKK